MKFCEVCLGTARMLKLELNTQGVVIHGGGWCDRCETETDGPLADSEALNTNQTKG